MSVGVEDGDVKVGIENPLNADGSIESHEPNDEQEDELVVVSVDGDADGTNVGVDVGEIVDVAVQDGDSVHVGVGEIVQVGVDAQDVEQVRSPIRVCRI